ncbi:MAG: hypothetical protein ACR2OW_15095, partial [Methyloligellaceae bacterium]
MTVHQSPNAPDLTGTFRPDIPGRLVKFHNSVLVSMFTAGQVAVPACRQKWGTLPVIRSINLTLAAIALLAIAGAE